MSTAAMIAIARDREPIDLLCWRVLGRTDRVTEQVLALNPAIAAVADALPEGTPVTLPAATAATPPTRDIVTLWDQ